MSNRLMSGVAPAALCAALTVGPAAAQLTVTASPDPNRLDPGVTKLSFRATVQRLSYPYAVVVLQCKGSTTAECPVAAPLPAVTKFAVVPSTKLGGIVTLELGPPYTIPSWASPDTRLCFGLATVVSSGIATYQTMDVECRTVSRPASAVASTDPATTQVTAVPNPAPGRTANAADQPPATVTSVPLPPPDLTLAYEKAPEARWVVRNIGKGPAPATVMRLSRAGLPDKDIAIPALVAGATFAVVVTPELDGYLVNAKGMVDPDKQIGESSESNNSWQSVQSR